MYLLVVDSCEVRYKEEYEKYEEVESAVNEWFIEAMHFGYNLEFCIYKDGKVLKIGTLSC